MAGTVASRLMVTVSVAVPPAEDAVQVKLVSAVSSVTEPLLHRGVVMSDSASVVLHDTATSEACQPLAPSVPVTGAAPGCLGATPGFADRPRGRGAIVRKGTVTERLQLPASPANGPGQQVQPCYWVRKSSFRGLGNSDAAVLGARGFVVFTT